MPSITHEALIEMFRYRPTLAADLLTNALGVSVPAFHQARIAPGEFTDLAPTEYRADAVVILSAADAPVLAVVVEAQLGRDKGKRWSWPVYLTTLRARLKCPAILLVVCVDAGLAAWCARPIALGHPGWTLSPPVFGPDRIPVVVDVDEAERAPEVAVLSALSHADHPDRDKILIALVGALAVVDRERATLYSDVVFAALPAAARGFWRH